MAPCSGQTEGRQKKGKEAKNCKDSKVTASKKSSLALLQRNSSFLRSPVRSWARDMESVGRESYGRKKMCCGTPHLEFPPGVKFLQALHGLLPVHHGGYSGPLLQEGGETIRGLAEVGDDARKWSP